MTETADAPVPEWFDVGDAARVGDRPNQQDMVTHVWLSPPEDIEKGAPREGRLLIVVADGMGGHVGGDVASHECVTGFIRAATERQTEPAPDILRAGLESANRRIRDRLKDQPELRGMGTTLIGVILEQQKKGKVACWHISVGDSLLLKWRPGKKGLERVNAEHSVAAQLQKDIKSGAVSARQAESDPRRNQGHVLTSAVMGTDEVDFEIDAPAEPMIMKPGEVLIAASDGLETLEDAAVAKLVHENADATAREVASALADAVIARRKPQQDNVSIVIAEVKKKPGMGLF